MRKIKRILRIILITLTGFLTLTAIPGGIALLAGFKPPDEFLTGSIFKSFLVPGLALALLVGGSAILALILLIRKSKFGTLFSTVTGIVIMSFEFTEVLIIGTPPGIAGTLQIFYFGLGTIITIISIIIWFIDLLPDSKTFKSNHGCIQAKQK